MSNRKQRKEEKEIRRLNRGTPLKNQPTNWWMILDDEIDSLLKEEENETQNRNL